MQDILFIRYVQETRGNFISEKRVKTDEKKKSIISSTKKVKKKGFCDEFLKIMKAERKKKQVVGSSLNVRD